MGKLNKKALWGVVNGSGFYGLLKSQHRPPSLEYFDI